MDLQGMFSQDRSPPRFRQTLAAAAKWMAAALVIAWVMICLTVSVLTFLAGLFPSADTAASKKETTGLSVSENRQRPTR